MKIVVTLTIIDNVILKAYMIIIVKSWMENPKNDVSSHSFEKLIDHCEFWVQME